MSKQAQSQQPQTLPMWQLMITGGFSACVAEFFTIPLDTAKVRLQLQKKGAGEGHYNGVLDCLKTMAKEEGFTSLWAGLLAGYQRQMVFASLRLGLYEPIRNFYAGEGHQGDSGLGVKIMSGLTTGTIAMMVANPTDLVKIRLQAQGIAARNDPSKIKYTGVIDCYKKVLNTEGVLAFWTGVGPNILRNAVINAAELSTFDQTKQILINNKIMQDNVWCHLVCSSIAGFCATVVGSPIDVIKTRIMNADKSKQVGLVSTVSNVIKKEGFGAFYNGFWANAQRIVSWNICMFVTWGQIKKMAGEHNKKH